MGAIKSFPIFSETVDVGDQSSVSFIRIDRRLDSSALNPDSLRDQLDLDRLGLRDMRQAQLVVNSPNQMRHSARQLHQLSGNE